MRIEFGPDQMALCRWCFRLIEDMGDAGIIRNYDTDCTIILEDDGKALLKVRLADESDLEILEEIMENANIESDVDDSYPEHGYRLSLGG
jgi:hypothetical protein